MVEEREHIMDQIRLEQIDQLDKAIIMWREKNGIR